MFTSIYTIMIFVVFGLTCTALIRQRQVASRPIAIRSRPRPLQLTHQQQASAVPQAALLPVAA